MTCNSIACWVDQFNTTDPQTNYVSLVGEISAKSIIQMIQTEIDKRKKSIEGFRTQAYRAANHSAQNQIDNTRLKQYERQKEIVTQFQKEQQAKAEAERAARAEVPATIQIYNEQAGQLARQDDKQDLIKLAAILGAFTLLG